MKNIYNALFISNFNRDYNTKVLPRDFLFYMPQLFVAREAMATYSAIKKARDFLNNTNLLNGTDNSLMQLFSVKGNYTEPFKILAAGIRRKTKARFLPHPDHHLKSTNLAG